MFMSNFFQLAQLCQAHLSDFMHLQNTVYDVLCPEKKSFIKPRSREQIVQHMANDMPVLGVFNQKALMAAVIISYPDVTQCYDAAHPMIKGHDLSNVSIIGGLYVHPSMRHQGVAYDLVLKANILSMMQGRNQLCAKISVANTSSIKTFAKAGFKEKERFICPEHGAHVMTMQKTIGSDVMIGVKKKYEFKHPFRAIAA